MMPAEIYHATERVGEDSGVEQFQYGVLFHFVVFFRSKFIRTSGVLLHVTM